MSKDGSAVDAYALTHGLLNDCKINGIAVFDHTHVTQIIHHKKSVELITADGRKIKAKKLVIACGYESQKYISKKVQSLQTTYAIISEPFMENKFWFKNALIWETAHPYLYLRTTRDNRILIGGKDDDFSAAYKRDEALPQKMKVLENAFRKLFPAHMFRTDFGWAGAFASTKDGLPYIGSVAQRPNTYFALGYGGNGITFSVIAARIITDQILGVKNTDAEIFRFDR